MKIFNLDCPNEVEEFWQTYQLVNGRRLANLLGWKGKESTNNAYLYHGYAANKITAISCRKAGNIATALSYEGICERIYNRMPDNIKW